MRVEFELPDQCGCTCCSAKGWIPDGTGGWTCPGGCGCRIVAVSGLASPAPALRDRLTFAGDLPIAIGVALHTSPFTTAT